MKKSSFQFRFSLSLFFILDLGSSALGAPCCGGGSSLPGIITGDHLGQMTATYSHGSVIGDAPSEGIPVFRSDSDQELSQILRLEGAYRVEDRTQIGLGVPLVQRSRSRGDRSRDSASGLGDIAFDAAYEVLPEWGYSAWRPKGFASLQLTLPTGPSVYEDQSALGIESRGRGFYSLGTGVVLSKIFGNWDCLFSGELHRSFSKTTPDGIRLNPGWGSGALVGLGFSPGGSDLRMGLSFGPIYEGPIHVEGAINSVSASQLVWNTGASLSALVSQDWFASASYVDQTLFGPAKNVALSRTFGVSFQRRWNP